MEKTKAFVSSYALALFEMAKAEQKLEEVESGLRLASETLKSNLDFKKALEETTVSKDKRKEMLKKVFSSRVLPSTLSLMQLLVDSEKIAVLPLIFDEYSAFLRAFKKEVVAYVTTAVPLGGQQSNLLQEKLSRVTKKEIKIRPIVDKSVLGGVVVKIGSQIVDNSLRLRLENLRKSMSLSD